MTLGSARATDLADCDGDPRRVPHRLDRDRARATPL